MAAWWKKYRSPELLAWIGASAIRLLGKTIRWEVVDEAGVGSRPSTEPVIWLLWHNRVFLMVYAQTQVVKKRRGVVLTSPSNDGEIIAGIMERFGHGAVRGSSNKRPAAALRELVRVLREGDDVAITPDGPRGPRYELQAGAIKLSQLSGIPLMPVHLNYRRAWQLKSWDGFLVPKPFTKAKLVTTPFVDVPRDADREEIEKVRSKLEALMRSGTTMSV